MMMKKIKKISALIALALVMCFLFTGCEGIGSIILSALSLDVETEDPATIMVADIAGKTEKSSGNISGDYKYTVYTDNTVCITAYTGKGSCLSLPAEIDGMPVIGLENKALMKNETIAELIFPDSLEVIGNYAVMYCDNLEKVTFGRNIAHIGVSAFEGTKKESHVGGGKLSTLVFNGAPKVISEKAFYFCDDLSEIVLPDGVETIGEWAFAKCFGAKRIILPDSVKSIGDHAFLKCDSAKEAVIPGSCEYIDVSAFYQCTSIEKLTLGEGIKELRKGAFEECSSLKEVVLPESLVTLGKYAFYNCTSLKKVTIGSATVNFDGDIFENAGELTVVAPESSAAAEYAQKNNFNIIFSE